MSKRGLGRGALLLGVSAVAYGAMQLARLAQAEERLRRVKEAAASSADRQDQLDLAQEERHAANRSAVDEIRARLEATDSPDEQAEIRRELHERLAALLAANPISLS